MEKGSKKDKQSAEKALDSTSSTRVVVPESGTNQEASNLIPGSGTNGEDTSIEEINRDAISWQEKSYKITKTVCQSLMSKNKYKNTSNAKVKGLVLDAITKLNTVSMEDVATRILTLIETCRDVDAARPSEAKRVDMTIQTHVHRIKSSQLNAIQNRIANMLYLSKLASFINAVPKSERSQKYKDMVRAEYATEGQFDKANKGQKQLGERMKKWQRLKDDGEKISKLTIAFGDGVLLALPKSMLLVFSRL